MERIDPQYRDYTLLTESQVSKSISAAKKLVMDKLGYSNEEADDFVRVKLRGELPALRTDNGGKFILGVTRMFCDRQLTDGGVIMALNRTIELVASDAHINEYDRNLNDLSAQELIDRFAGARQEMGNKDREEVGTLELQENNNYTIIQIDNFSQSSKYAQYTDWCITYDKNMLDRYTSGGVGQFYFCLKNGFEDIPRQKGEGCPLDEYGLSMVAVSVTETGDLNTCTCRWNHANGGDDHVMDTKQVSQLIGRNFYEVFKPNNKWQETLNTINQKLASGLTFKEIEELRLDSLTGDGNNSYGIVCVTGTRKYNYLQLNTTPQKLISDKWFDDCCGFRKETFNGEDFIYAEVELNYKSNFIRPNGKLVSEQWFRRVHFFDGDGFAEVFNNDGYVNLLRYNGTLLSPNLWFSSIYAFHDGWARVEYDNNENLINLNGDLLMSDWYYSVSQIYNGYAIIGNKNAYHNYVNEKGEIISPKQWFGYCGFFTEYGCAVVRDDKKLNIIDGNGNLILNEWIKDENLGFVKFNFNGKELSLDTTNFEIGEKIEYSWYIAFASGSEYPVINSKKMFSAYKEAYYDGLERLKTISNSARYRLYVTRNFGNKHKKFFIACKETDGEIFTYA